MFYLLVRKVASYWLLVLCDDIMITDVSKVAEHPLPQFHTMIVLVVAVHLAVMHRAHVCASASQQSAVSAHAHSNSSVKVVCESDKDPHLQHHRFVFPADSHEQQ